MNIVVFVIFTPTQVHYGHIIHVCECIVSTGPWSLNTSALYADLEVLECTDGRVRLVDGPTATEGRVEVCQGGRWGTICNDHWTVEDTDVVCGELGLLSTGIILMH